ncbi:dihydroflavonol-4-reductase isoform X1 [Carex littledalei]|uniref:Dihydroflavonol-4-reductase isoform X1 n=1 Tax=Carex littledalei TaxID=544730 RepID=A0A833VFR8_9POAL|nr:dihydroflavonol-4-reductase isoform X1 [Carex littledalei]
MKRVCVTGTTGYIGSWLVRSLLQQGYHVHATARDPEKAQRMLSTIEGTDRLQIYRADLNEDRSFDEVVKGCVGLFHVAALMEFGTSVQENVEDHVRRNILEPAVLGTRNLLQSCMRSGTIKRVVFTSSISTITAKDEKGDWTPVVDESSVTPTDLVWKTKNSGWVYVLLKLATEEEAFKFAKENGIDLVSIIPPTVAGSFLTPTVPSSLQVLLSPITGDPNFYPVLDSVHSRLGSIALVHIEDICRAHIFLFETSGASGRYLFKEEFNRSAPSIISSKRLLDLGYRFEYDAKDVIKDSIQSSIGNGFLNSQVEFKV